MRPLSERVAPKLRTHSPRCSLGLMHSSEGSSEYGDVTGYMGGGSRELDTPLKCFNPAHSFELGWYQSRHFTCVPAQTRPAHKTHALRKLTIDTQGLFRCATKPLVWRRATQVLP